MATTTKTNPIKLREQLHEQAERVALKGEAQHVAYRKAEQDLQAVEVDLAQARMGEARGLVEPEAVADLVEQRKALREQLEAITEEGDSLRRAARAIEEEEEALIRAHREAFVAWAFEAVAAAEQALDALRPVYEEAFEKWHEAQVRFAFTSALDDIGAAPSWPWPSPGEVFRITSREAREGRRFPRTPVPAGLWTPPAVEPEALPQVWQRTDGVIQVVRDLDHVATLEDERDWRMIAAGRAEVEEALAKRR
jgi:hypothetical protein